MKIAIKKWQVKTFNTLIQQQWFDSKHERLEDY